MPISKRSLSDLKFWLYGQKPFVTPLIFKIFNRNWAKINDFFIIIYILSSLFLIFAVANFFKNIREKILISYFLILLFLNQSSFSMWLTVAHSEIPATVMTLFILAIFGCCYQYKKFINSRWLTIYITIGIITLTAILFSFSRDTNMYFLLIMALFYAMIFKKIRYTIIVTAMFSSLFIVQNSAMVKSGRWKFSLANVVMQRIIPDINLRRLFQKKYHLPADEFVMPCAKKWASSNCKNKEFIFSLDGLNRDWVSKYGINAYKDFLIKNPRYVFKKWINNWHHYNAGIWRPGDRVITKKLNTFIFHFPGPISFYLALIIFFTGGVFLKKNPLILFSISFALVVGIIAWHGDAMEVTRHFQQASITLKISFLIFLVQIWSIISQKSKSTSELAKNT